MSMVQLKALTEHTSFGEALLLPIEFWCLLQGEEFGIRELEISLIWLQYILKCLT
jgi:hypothetical protein